MSIAKVNGTWRANCADAPEPKEEPAVSGNLSVSSADLNLKADNIGTASWATSVTASTTYDYSGYNYRWDGLRWIYEPDWIWPGYVYQYPGCWTTTSTSGFRVLQWNGKTIIYRLTNSQIEFAVVSSKGEVNFIYTDSLETVLKALK